MSKELIENLECISFILDLIYSAIIAIDKKENVIISNDYCEKFFGIKRGKILNKNI